MGQCCFQIYGLGQIFMSVWRWVLLWFEFWLKPHYFSLLSKEDALVWEDDWIYILLQFQNDGYRKYRRGRFPSWLGPLGGVTFTSHPLLSFEEDVFTARREQEYQNSERAHHSSLYYLSHDLGWRSALFQMYMSCQEGAFNYAKDNH